MWSYLGAGAGCAVSNYIGNEGNHIVAVIAIAATLAFILIVLKPIDLSGLGPKR